MSRGDLVVVGFSGHVVHLDGTSYFCPIDAELDRTDSLLSFEKLYQLLALSPADVKLMLVDACRNDPRSGGTKELKATTESTKLAQSLDKPPQGILVLSSFAPGQVSVEDQDLGHGVFMNYLLDGLSGQSDRTEGNRNERVVRFYAAQKPINGRGSTPLTRSLRKTLRSQRLCILSVASISIATQMPSAWH